MFDGTHNSSPHSNHEANGLFWLLIQSNYTTGEVVALYNASRPMDIMDVERQRRRFDQDDYTFDLLDPPEFGE